MDVKLTFKKKSLRLFLQVLLLNFIAANSYGASIPLARSATRADIRDNPTASVASSNPLVVTASIMNQFAIPGMHTLSISSLAQAEQVISTNTFSNQTSPLGITETLTIMAAGSKIKVDVAATDSFQDIVNKINYTALDSHLNAAAYVVATQSNQYQLIIGATQTGIANAVSVSESGTDGNILSMSRELTAASDATFTFDWLSYSTNSNNIIIGDWLMINLVSVGQATLSVYSL